ncbi:MAG: hypothetical protein ACOH2L_17875 [Devosia sp.]
MKTQPEAETPQACILYQGRALSQAEALGFAPKTNLGRSALPLLISSWVALSLVITSPLLGLVSIAVTPLICFYFDRKQRA